MSSPDPPNYFAAKYSFPHAAAATVVHGHTGYSAFTDTVVHDPVIASLRHRVHMREDPALTALTPRLKPARVTVTLRDGRQSTRSCDSARGDYQRPYAASEIRAKFHELAQLVLTPDGATSIERAMTQCEQWTSVVDLITHLRGAALPL
jgi:2-methylcitrate dehydratase PrpD